MFVVRFQGTPDNCTSMEVLGKFYKYSQAETFVTQYISLLGNKPELYPWDFKIPKLRIDYVDNFRGRRPK